MCIFFIAIGSYTAWDATGIHKLNDLTALKNVYYY